jgi:hypothetical protein
MELFGQSSNARSRNHAGRKNWWSDLSLDAAKLGLLLYVLGLLASSFYYSRFSILSLDLAKPQCILLGIYVVGLYVGLPAATLFSLRRTCRVGVISAVLVTVLCASDAGLALAAHYRPLTLILLVLLTVTLQFFFFADFVSLWRSANNGRLQITFVLPPPRVKALLFALLFCVHFSQFAFPQIPAFLGGAKPLSVQVFTKTANLPANRFFMSKNQPQINNSIDSFSLRLLYETDKDVYFVNDLQSGDNLIGYSIMRLKKDEILRMDYVTPKWVQWKGGQ